MTRVELWVDRFSRPTYHRGMPSSDSFVNLLLALLLFTSFVKIATALTVFRYGAGLTGFEFGVVTLIASFSLAVVGAPPELSKLGFPTALFSDQTKPRTDTVLQALLPFMSARVDPKVGLAIAEARKSRVAGGGSAQGDGAAASSASTDLAVVGPAFLISELKIALSVGLMLLVPFLLIDLLVAHLLALLGIGHLSTATVSLPLKLVLFVAADGWSLLVSKLLGA